MSPRGQAVSIIARFLCEHDGFVYINGETLNSRRGEAEILLDTLEDAGINLKWANE